MISNTSEFQSKYKFLRLISSTKLLIKIDRIKIDRMEDIESKEELLLQHIRSSGLKKQRETSLIDEVLDLRKCRRQVFTALTEKLKDLQSKIDSNKLDTNLIIKSFDEKQEKYKRDLALSVNQLKEKLKNEAIEVS